MQVPELMTRGNMSTIIQARKVLREAVVNIYPRFINSWTYITFSSGKRSPSLWSCRNRQEPPHSKLIYMGNYSSVDRACGWTFKDRPLCTYKALQLLSWYHLYSLVSLSTVLLPVNTSAIKPLFKLLRVGLNAVKALCNWFQSQSKPSSSTLLQILWKKLTSVMID